MEKFKKIIDIAVAASHSVVHVLAYTDKVYPRIITLQATGIADGEDPIPTASVDIFGSVNGGSSWFPIDSVDVAPATSVDSGVINTPVEQLKYVLDETTVSTSGTIEIDLLVDYEV